MGYEDTIPYSYFKDTIATKNYRKSCRLFVNYEARGKKGALKLAAVLFVFGEQNRREVIAMVTLCSVEVFE